MSSISAQISLIDKMSSPLYNINSAIEDVILSLNSVDGAITEGFDSSKIFQAMQEISMASSKIEEMAEEIRRAAEKQEKFNNTVKQGSSVMDGLVGKVIGMASAYAGMQGVRKMVDLSDSVVQTTARLELILDDGGSVDELEAKIFESAQRSRANFLDVTNSVVKLGQTAKQNFSGMDEIVAFTELLNKNFIVGGAGAQEQASAMYQLTQAMASGRLQGDEYRSIIENAPLLAKSIEDYMHNVRGAEGSMKDWASQGLLTADVIRAAVFKSAKQIEEDFERMPMTWGQIWTTMSNSFISMSEPILNILSWMAEHWSILAPLVGAVAFLMAGYVATLGVYKGLTMAAAVAESLRAAALAKQTRATFATTVAQESFNVALLASPVTWIIGWILLLVALFYGLIAAVNKFTKSSISATGMITGAFNVLFAIIINGFLAVLEIALGVINGLINPYINFANFLGNLFHSPISAVIYLFQSMADTALSVLQSIASAMDFVFGTKMGDTIAGWRNGLKSMADEMVKEYAPNENYQKVMDNMNLSVESMGLKRWAYADAYSSGYAFGENMGKSELGQTAFPDFGSNMTNHVSEIASNTKDIKNSVEMTGEDIKHLIEKAEEETINRFTTAEIRVDMVNNNTVNSGMDLDGIVDRLTDGVNEAMEKAAEGVHR